MYRTLIAFLFFIIGFSAFSQTPVLKKLDELGVKNATVRDNPTAAIKKMYLFDENNLNGALIVFTLRELKLDVFAVLIRSGSAFTVRSIAAVNQKAYGTVMMGRINTALSRWDNMQESAIPDAISSATRYAKAQYSEIRDVVAGAFSILRKTSVQ